MAFIRELACPLDAVDIARALGGARGLAWLRADARGAIRAEDARFSFIACEPVESSDALVPGDAPTPGDAAEKGWGGHAAAPRWIGVIPYEAMRSLERRPPCGDDVRAAPFVERPSWRRYDAVVRVDHASGVVAIEADDARAAARLEGAMRASPPRAREPLEVRLEPSCDPPAAHADRVRAALEYIARGDIYLVNLARRIPLAMRGDPLELFVSLFSAAPAPFGFYADLDDVVLCGASPELAIEVRGDRIRTAPIKGTRPRGADAPADRGAALALDADPKERAELTMAIDLHRNDLGRVAVPGSVRVLGAPAVLAGRTVWSRYAEIVARSERGIRLADVARAMLPCGSVTGAPKVRAMEIIAELEPTRRGAYTGAFGAVGRDGSMTLAVAIRTLELDGRGVARRPGADSPLADGFRRGAYHAGGGIVCGSDPEREVEETRWKASQLISLVRGGGADGTGKLAGS